MSRSLRPGSVTSPACCSVTLVRDQLDFEIRAVIESCSPPRHHQHVGEDRHRLPALDDADDCLQGGEDVSRSALNFIFPPVRLLN